MTCIYIYTMFKCISIYRHVYMCEGKTVNIYTYNLGLWAYLNKYLEILDLIQKRFYWWTKAKIFILE